MDIVDKVIRTKKWLECCREYDDFLDHEGCTEECPYYENEYACSPTAMYDDALEVLAELIKMVEYWKNKFDGTIEGRALKDSAMLESIRESNRGKK